MNWPFIIRATLFGLLFFLYNVASGVVVLGAMPDTFGWMKLAASGVVAFVIGTFTFVRDPERAWNDGPGVKKILAVLACVGLLTACGAPQITIPAGVAAVEWGQIRSDYATGKAIITVACSRGKIDAAGCESLNAVDIRAQALRSSVERALMNMEAPIDWVQVLEYSKTVTEMLLKLGVLVAK